MIRSGLARSGEGSGITTNNKHRELERRAYHEAGHAVTALVFGSTVTGVTLEPEGETHRDRLLPPGDVDREHAKREIMVCYAGAAAEGLFHKRDEGEPGPCVTGQDDSNTLYAFSVLEAGWPRNTREYFRKRRELRESLWSETIELVRQNREPITALTAELVRKRGMNRNEIQAFAGAWGLRSNDPNSDDAELAEQPAPSPLIEDAEPVGGPPDGDEETND